jgi:DNA-binding response OmpR family regulator
MVRRLLDAMSRKKSVLIIDDEKDFSHFLKLNLENTGRFKVFTASDGQSGVKLVQRKRPDVVLLDIMMAGMNGLEVLEKLKGSVKTYEIPVIMLTALDNKEYRSEARGFFAGEYLVKPVSLDKLISTIDRVAVYGQ